MAQLQKIGGNLNQITKRINETGRIYDNDMDELKRLMDQDNLQKDDDNGNKER